jgi:hypothetical protein
MLNIPKVRPYYSGSKYFRLCKEVLGSVAIKEIGEIGTSSGKFGGVQASVQSVQEQAFVLS